MKKTIFLASLLLSCISIFGADLSQIESTLLPQIKNIDAYNKLSNSKKIRANQGEKHAEHNKVFTEELLKYTSEDASTLTQSFDSLRKYMFIVTSLDRKFRIYSWLKDEKDDMRYYENIFQYEANGKIYSTKLVEDDDLNPKGLFTAIETLQKDSTHIIYLGIMEAAYSDNDFYTSIEPFKIEGDNLVDSLMIFKVLNKQNKLETKHNLSVLYNPNKKRADKTPIKFESKKKTIKMRMVNSDGEIQSESETYEFDGEFFVKPEKK